MGIQEDYGQQDGAAGEDVTYAQRQRDAQNQADNKFSDQNLPTGDPLTATDGSVSGAGVPVPAGFQPVRQVIPNVAPVTHTNTVNGDVLEHKYDPDLQLWYTETNQGRQYTKRPSDLPADVQAARSQDRASREYHEKQADPANLDGTPSHPGALQPALVDASKFGSPHAAESGIKDADNLTPPDNLGQLTYIPSKTIGDVSGATDPAVDNSHPPYGVDPSGNPPANYREPANQQDAAKDGEQTANLDNAAGFNAPVDPNAVNDPNVQPNPDTAVDPNAQPDPNAAPPGA